ncbi:MAG: lycopene beta-cyclase CrtY [Holophagae bacterium]
MKTELVLVGGGLANSLIAYRILAEEPDFPLLVVERQPTLGADHTWSFHDSDLTDEQRRWIRPLVAHSWSRHELRFPRRRRVIDGGYNSVTSAGLHGVVADALGDRMLVGAEVAELSADRVRLADGGEIRARAVVDGRGDPGARTLEVGYQKFVGLFVRLAHGHGLDGPILMDATVAQRDGYRFVYTLPLSDHELLIEDTYYSDGPDLDPARIGVELRSYAARQGWEIRRVTGQESGVLPIVLGGDIRAFWAHGAIDVARSGMRGAFFHPTTGYSLPEAVALAELIAEARRSDGRALFRLTRRRSIELWDRGRFFRLLNRMLFRAADPDKRYRVFERFYGLPEPLIRRFYAGRLKSKDKVRLVIGRPPVPIGRALRCLIEPSSSMAPGTTTRRG